jgi:hypothetical protein
VGTTEDEVGSVAGASDEGVSHGGSGSVDGGVVLVVGGGSVVHVGVVVVVVGDDGSGGLVSDVSGGRV